MESSTKKLNNGIPNLDWHYETLPKNTKKSFLFFVSTRSDPEPEIFFKADWAKVKKFFIKEIPIIAHRIIR
ncbi:MAG: hypothetical protein AAB693_02485 [Patescibacteria group bacterium]